jgi:hypothetical protein
MLAAGSSGVRDLELGAGIAQSIWLLAVAWTADGFDSRQGQEIFLFSAAYSVQCSHITEFINLLGRLLIT